MYIFEKVVKEDGDIFASWLKHESVDDWIGIDDWYRYFEYVSSTPDYFLIKVLVENKIIGVICLEIIDETGYISYIINPEEQHKGHGKRTLNLFLEQINKFINRKFKYICAGIFPDNIASKRCFESCGFKFSKNGDDGEMIYIYSL